MADERFAASMGLGLNDAERCLEQARRAERADEKVVHFAAAIDAVARHLRHMEGEARRAEMNREMENTEKGSSAALDETPALSVSEFLALTDADDGTRSLRKH